MRKIILLLSIFILLSASCRKEDKFLVIDAGKIITGEKLAPITDLTQDIGVIPLETTDESYIESIYRISLHNENIFVTNIRRNLLEFNSNGKFKQQIGRIGRGPGEYSNIIYHEINRENDEILLMGTGILNIYSKDGEFKHNLEPANHLQVYTVANNHIFYMAHANYGERVVDLVEIRNMKNEFITGIKNRAPGGNMAYFPIITSDNDGVYYKEELSDTLYRIDPVSLDVNPVGVIDFGERGFTHEVFNYDSMEKWGDLYRLERFWVNDDYFIFSLQKELIEPQFRSFVYHIKDEKFYELKIGEIPLSLMDYYDNEIVAYAEAVTICSNLDTINDDNILETFSVVNEDSNPVIFKIRLQ